MLITSNYPEERASASCAVPLMCHKELRSGKSHEAASTAVRGGRGLSGAKEPKGVAGAGEEGPGTEMKASYGPSILHVLPWKVIPPIS